MRPRRDQDSVGREASKPGRAALQELGGQRFLVVLFHGNPGKGFQHENVHFTVATEQDEERF